MDKLELKIDSLGKKIDELQGSINNLKRIFFWTLVVSIALFVLPLVGLMFAIPQFLSIYNEILQ